MTTDVPYRSLPLDQSDVRYTHGPDSIVQQAVPAGTTTAFEWRQSTVYPGTSRTFWVHVPAQYDPAEPAALIAFRRVICCLASFVQMPGGNPYPGLIPEGPRKPLRIFMQAGHRDLHWNKPEWNWLASNLRVATALVEATYDVRLVLGDGGHSPNHGGVVLPDALRWAFRPIDTGPPEA